MNAVLKSGKDVRGCSGSSLKAAAYDFNAGEPYPDEQLERPFMERDIHHLHVYPGSRSFEFICSGQALTLAELNEARQVVEQVVEDAEAETEKLRETLLSPAGDQLVAERQGRNSDKQTASRDLARVLFPELVQARQNVSWAMVKDEIRRLRITAVA